MSKHPTDPAYDESRRKAEQTFYRGFDDWLQKLAEEAKQLRVVRSHGTFFCAVGLFIQFWAGRRARDRGKRGGFEIPSRSGL